ncbi:MAG: hypothetical protein NZZ41_07880, partial [Candidatus Dojkabacteria bacterium]|nr:hypothetical protein [Candidatus Dojkabacteria bacterium]
MKIDYENILPKEWHPELKEQFKKEIEDYVFVLTRTNFNYLEADKFKISSIIDREETFEDIVYTLAIDKMINIPRLEPPYFLIEDAFCYEDSMYIFPGTLLYNEARHFFYLFPERPVVLKNAYPYKGRIKIYYTNDKIGEKYLDVSNIVDVYVSRVYISSAIAFYVVQEFDGNVLETFVSHTNDVLDFYETFKNKDAKDILVLSSYKNSIRVYMSSRFVEKYKGRKIKMLYLNYPEFEFTDYSTPEYVQDLIYNKSGKKISAVVVEKTFNNFKSNICLYLPKEIPAFNSYLKRIPYLARFNNIIRSIDDVAALFLKKFEFMDDAEIFSYKYIDRDSNGNIINKKMIYFLVLAYTAYENKEIKEFIENELSNYYDHSFRRLRCVFLVNENTFDENLVHIYKGEDSYYRFIRENKTEINKEMSKEEKLRRAFEITDLFVINAAAENLRINLETDSDVDNVLDFIIFTRLKHYTRVIKTHIDF